MTNYTKWMISLVVLMIIVTVFVIWLIQDRLFETDKLTVHEASQKIEDLYGGSVESFEEKNDIFYMSLLHNNKTYDFQIDAETGDILSLSKNIVEKNKPNTSSQVKTVAEIRSLLNSQNKGTIHSITFQNAGDKPQYVVEITKQETLKNLVVNALTGEILSETVKQQNAPDTTKTTIISSEKAKQIALSQLSGTVEYVVYEGAGDGGYYLVQVNGASQGATYEIHAVSGKVLSVTNWNYPNREDDDDDDDTDNTSTPSTSSNSSDSDSDDENESDSDDDDDDSGDHDDDDDDDDDDD